MNLEGYITVSQRLQLALERWPDLRVVEEAPQLVDWPGGQVLVCTVKVYRSPDDDLPLVGRATEAIPGKTPFSKGSELMVGNTSALGRALGYAGLGIQQGLASADEIQAAQSRQEATPQAPRKAVLGSKAGRAPEPDLPPTGQRTPITELQKARLADLGYKGPMPASEQAAQRLIQSIRAADEQTEGQQ